MEIYDSSRSALKRKQCEHPLTSLCTASSSDDAHLPVNPFSLNLLTKWKQAWDLGLFQPIDTAPRLCNRAPCGRGAGCCDQPRRESSALPGWKARCAAPTQPGPRTRWGRWLKCSRMVAPLQLDRGESSILNNYYVTEVSFTTQDWGVPSLLFYLTSNFPTIMVLFSHLSQSTKKQGQRGHIWAVSKGTMTETIKHSGSCYQPVTFMSSSTLHIYLWPSTGSHCINTSCFYKQRVVLVDSLPADRIERSVFCCVCVCAGDLIFPIPSSAFIDCWVCVKHGSKGASYHGLSWGYVGRGWRGGISPGGELW